MALLLATIACTSTPFLNSYLMRAAAKGDTGEIQRLLDEGASIDAFGISGQRPLMMAVQEGQLDAVRLLVNSGADVLELDNRGETAIQRIRGQGDGAIVEILNTALLDRLPDVVGEGPTEDLERLIALGADIDERDANEETAS